MTLRRPNPKRQCELCGRTIRTAKKTAVKHGVWCGVCLALHKMHPDPCDRCDGLVHFPIEQGVISVVEL